VGTAFAGIIGAMLRFLLKRTPVKRLARGIPVVGLLSAIEVARLAGRHVAKLEPQERRRLMRLVAKARRGSGALSRAERDELAALAAKLERRRFVGSAASHFSPVPLPKRLLYGPNGGQGEGGGG
jgi:hypothetical protein